MNSLDGGTGVANPIATPVPLRIGVNLGRISSRAKCTILFKQHMSNDQSEHDYLG